MLVNTLAKSTSPPLSSRTPSLPLATLTTSLSKVIIEEESKKIKISNQLFCVVGCPVTPPSHPMDSTSPPSTMEGPMEGEVPKGVFNLSCLYGIYMEGYRLPYSGLFSRGKNFVFWGKCNYSWSWMVCV